MNKIRNLPKVNAEHVIGTQQMVIIISINYQLLLALIIMVVNDIGS